MLLNYWVFKMSPFIVNYYEWKKKQLTNDKKVIKYTSNKWLKVQPSHSKKPTSIWLHIFKMSQSSLKCFILNSKNLWIMSFNNTKKRLNKSESLGKQKYLRKLPFFVSFPFLLQLTIHFWCYTNLLHLQCGWDNLLF